MLRKRPSTLSRRPRHGQLPPPLMIADHRRGSPWPMDGSTLLRAGSRGRLRILIGLNAAELAIVSGTHPIPSAPGAS